MLGGFAGVYLAENAILLPGVSMTVSSSDTGRERVERKVGA
jgi:hypothetical protein